ncbi:hypothetical protein ACOSP7_001921 [Xanthoceras sorbifolium]
MNQYQVAGFGLVLGTWTMLCPNHLNSLPSNASNIGLGGDMFERTGRPKFFSKSREAKNSASSICCRPLLVIASICPPRFHLSPKMGIYTCHGRSQFSASPEAYKQIIIKIGKEKTEINTRCTKNSTSLS